MRSSKKYLLTALAAITIGLIGQESFIDAEILQEYAHLDRKIEARHKSIKNVELFMEEFNKEHEYALSADTSIVTQQSYLTGRIDTVYNGPRFVAQKKSLEADISVAESRQEQLKDVLHSGFITRFEYAASQDFDAITSGYLFSLAVLYTGFTLGLVSIGIRLKETQPPEYFD